MQKIILALRPLIRFNYNHPLLVLVSSIILAVVAGYFALQLRIDTDIASLLPETNDHVIALKELQETAGGETVMEVGIRSPDFDANVLFAELLIEESLQLFDERRGEPFIDAAEFRRDTEVLRDNALYLATEPELEQIISYLEEEIRKAREAASPFYIDFSDDFDDEVEEEEADFDRFRTAYDDLIPSEYPVNEDSTLIVLKMYPTGSQSDIQYLEDLFESFGQLVSTLEPATFHPEMEVKFGGRLKRHLNELEAIMDDVYSSFATGITSVILLVMFYFGFKKYFNYRRGGGKLRHGHFMHHLIRAPVPILVIGVPLLISLSWTFGLAYLVLGTLNTMTSVLFVILFGLGIDYGIHYYARYIEMRSDGEPILNALMNAYERTGTAIMVSAITTASALYVLIFADFRGFSEFGFIAGTGILLALFSMLFILPSLLVLFEKLKWILLTQKAEDNRQKALFRRYPFSRSIVTASIVIVGVILWNVTDLQFEYEFGKLEPEFPEYQEFREFTRGVDETERRNPAYILADRDEHLFEMLDIIREKQRDTEDTMIREAEALQERFPPTRYLEERKLGYIAEVRELLQNSFIVDQEDEDLDLLRRASQTVEPLSINEIPDFLVNRFITRDGEVGRFVIIYPAAGLSDGRNSIAFKEEIGRMELEDGTVYYAASTSIVAAEMLDLMIQESPYMVTATFLIVFFFMILSFRSFRWALMAMIPLVVGLLFLFGVMLITGMKFNFYNLVVLPAILGIGCDNGVHIAHRYRDEGKNSMWNVLSSTGQHISVGSFTTMLGFAGLLFTMHPGLQSIGVMAVIGIGLTLFTALTFLPSMIQLLEERDWIRF